MPPVPGGDPQAGQLEAAARKERESGQWPWEDVELQKVGSADIIKMGAFRLQTRDRPADGRRDTSFADGVDAIVDLPRVKTIAAG